MELLQIDCATEARLICVTSCLLPDKAGRHTSNNRFDPRHLWSLGDDHEQLVNQTNDLEGTAPRKRLDYLGTSHYFFRSTFGLCRMPRLPSTVQPRRLHLENVAHLHSFTNDFKQRKAFSSAKVGAVILEELFHDL